MCCVINVKRVYVTYESVRKPSFQTGLIQFTNYTQASQLLALQPTLTENTGQILNIVFHLSFLQAAADYVKAHLPEALKQHLQAYEREKKDSQLSYASILEQRILAVDRDMVEKFSVSHEEAGKWEKSERNHGVRSAAAVKWSARIGS